MSWRAAQRPAPCARLQNEATKLKKVWRLKNARGAPAPDSPYLVHCSHTLALWHWELYKISRPYGLLILTMQHINTNVSFHLSSRKQWSFYPKAQIRIDISLYSACVKVRPPRRVSPLSLRQSSICPPLISRAGSGGGGRKCGGWTNHSAAAQLSTNRRLAGRGGASYC